MLIYHNKPWKIDNEISDLLHLPTSYCDEIKLERKLEPYKYCPNCGELIPILRIEFKKDFKVFCGNNFFVGNCKWEGSISKLIDYEHAIILKNTKEIEKLKAEVELQKNLIKETTYKLQKISEKMAKIKQSQNTRNIYDEWKITAD